MTNILKLRMVLKDIKPLIWRKLEVSDAITFEELHLIIQKIMGWNNYHLYDFDIGKNIKIDCNLEEYLETAPDNAQFRVFDSRDLVLSDFIENEKEKFLYTYDFGDNWRIEITVNSILPKKRVCKKVACLSGKRNAPPEDSGGPWGYVNSLEILKNIKHIEYKEKSEWFGKDFDPEYFNLKAINERLEAFNR